MDQGNDRLKTIALNTRLVVRFQIIRCALRTVENDYISVVHRYLTENFCKCMNVASWYTCPKKVLRSIVFFWCYWSMFLPVAVEHMVCYSVNADKISGWNTVIIVDLYISQKIRLLRFAVCAVVTLSPSKALCQKWLLSIWNTKTYCETSRLVWVEFMACTLQQWTLPFVHTCSILCRIQVWTLPTSGCTRLRRSILNKTSPEFIHRFPFDVE